MTIDRFRLTGATLILGTAIVAAGCAGAGSSDGDPTSADPVTCPSEGEPMDTTRLYIEHNATDEDTGVHGFFGGEAWSELCLSDPDGDLIFVFDPRSQLDDLTVADVFFESREPENGEFAVAELLQAFPEGAYLVAGTDFTGTPRVGTARFTHTIASEPQITSPALAEEPALATSPVTAGDLVVTWERVVESIAGEPVEIVAYEVIVTKEDHEDPDAASRPIHDVHLGGDRTSSTVPADFLEADTIYELEVIAIEASGNQTIGLGFFRTG